jgi:hypothetical protein
MGDTPWGRHGEKAWALVRLLLGTAQMTGATAALYLLLATGLNEITMGTLLLTCVCTSVSVFLFGGRKDGKE